MVRDGMLGGSNRPLRRQEKGKIEALCSSSCVGAVRRRQARASMRHPPPGRDSNGLKCRKSEIGDIFLFLARTWQASDHIPQHVYVSGGCRRRALDKGGISAHWCPKLRSSLMAAWGY